MERVKVDSSFIRSIGYDPQPGILEVEFADGGIYRYSDVPEFIYRGFVLSRSKGEYFNTRIVDHYPFTSA